VGFTAEISSVAVQLANTVSWLYRIQLNRFLSVKLPITRMQWTQWQQLVLYVQDRGVEYRELAQREEQLQKQVINLSEENMELKFEVEQANRDIPRLKVTFCQITRILSVHCVSEKNVTLCLAIWIICGRNVTD